MLRLHCPSVGVDTGSFYVFLCTLVVVVVVVWSQYSYVDITPFSCVVSYLEKP
jgi:hypothetical protein